MARRPPIKQKRQKRQNRARQKAKESQKVAKAPEPKEKKGTPVTRDLGLEYFTMQKHKNKLVQSLTQQMGKRVNVTVELDQEGFYYLAYGSRVFEQHHYGKRVKYVRSVLTAPED